MSEDAQCALLLEAISSRPMTALEILAELGIARASARIYDLRRHGYVIHSTEIVVRNRQGKPCRVARYSAPTAQKLLIPHMPGRSRFTHRPGKKDASP
ncbi:helix-turn-helix domain-containing protein [Stenotrophomonas nitritireducens]|uniref:helix-turn-helix domain-containing protein n=1 Tax=Stenotrophomonas nitritireducens TaxID=83617 RepID=UPI000709756A|nr:helix-turn-helix domain-containing protein [Stenotrophomonas nitritireducens]